MDWFVMHITYWNRARIPVSECQNVLNATSRKISKLWDQGSDYLCLVISSTKHFYAFLNISLRPPGNIQGNLTVVCGGSKLEQWLQWTELSYSPLVSDPGMHHGTCVTHVPWCMSGSLTRAGGENVPGIPGACTTCYFTYIVKVPCRFE